MKLRSFCLFLCFFYTIKVVAQDSTRNITSLNIQKCVEIAISNNLNVAQSELAAKRANIGFNQAKLNLLPNFGANVQQGLNQGRSIDPFTNAYLNQQINYTNYSVGGSIILFNGFVLWNTIKQNLLAFEASKQELQQQKDNLTLNVILAYLQILNNQELVNQSRNQAAVTQEQIRRSEILNKDGAIAPYQLADLKGQLSNDSLSIINNQNNLEAAKVALAQYMNVPYQKQQLFEPLNAEQLSSSYNNNPDAIYHAALEQLSLVKASNLRTKSAAKAVSSAHGYLYPTLSLNAYLYTNYSSAASKSIFTDSARVATNDYVNLQNGTRSYVMANQNNYRQEKISYQDQFKNNYNSAITLGLQIPIFTNWVARNRIALAKIDLKNAELVEQTTRIQLKQSVEQAFFNMIAAFSRYKTLQSQVSSYIESFKATEVKFNAGVGTSVDYTVAKNKLDAANINLISARYDYVLRMKILDYYQGKLTW
ncbi:TolC family protein [Mucilaginibacter arboris]|nr:TolC family protein [Mucilaginibacter arboris]